MEKELVTRLQAIGMTRQELASSLGVSLSSIYHWREIPKYVEAYLDSRYREAGLAVSSVQGDMGTNGIAVQLRDGEGDAAAVRDQPRPEVRPVESESVGGRRRG